MGDNPAYAKNQPTTFSEEKIVKAAEECIDGDIRDEVLNNPVCYEEPEETVDILASFIFRFTLLTDPGTKR